VADARQALVDLAAILGLDLAQRDTSDTIEGAPFIELLIQIRADLRAARQFEIADTIRERLTKLGVTLEDTKQGTTWKAS
jgi:cysteinyl-tRNA synthetase